MALVLRRTKVQELVTGKKRLIYVHASTPLAEVVQLFKVHDVTAMPVAADRKHHADKKPGDKSLQKSKSTDASGFLKSIPFAQPSSIRFIGVISLVDVALYLSSQASESAGLTSPSLANVKVSDVMARTEESRHMLVIDPHATVRQAMRLLGSRGFHRALVPNECPTVHEEGAAPIVPAFLRSAVGGEGEEEHEGGEHRHQEFRVLSQMDLLSFLLAHEGLLGLSLAHSIDDVGLVWPSVVSVSPHTPLREAFELMQQYAIRAVAVVEESKENKPKAARKYRDVVAGAGAGAGAAGGEGGETGLAGLSSFVAETDKFYRAKPRSAADGRLVGTLSTSDAKFCHVENADVAKEIYTLTVQQFLDQCREEGKGRGVKRTPVVTCCAHTPLRHVMRSMVAHGVHRLWVTDCNCSAAAAEPCSPSSGTSPGKDKRKEEGKGGEGGEEVLQQKATRDAESGEEECKAQILEEGGGDRLIGVVSVTDIVRVMSVLPLVNVEAIRALDLKQFGVNDEEVEEEEEEEEEGDAWSGEGVGGSPWGLNSLYWLDWWLSESAGAAGKTDKRAGQMKSAGPKWSKQASG